MEKTVIEVKTSTEIEKILFLFKDSLASLSQGEEYRTLMAKKFASHGTVLCLLNEDSVDAFAAFYCNDKIGKTAYLSMIAVNQEKRGHGLGRILLTAIEQFSLEEGMQNLKFEVAKKNSNAIRFYENNGYAMIEEKKQSLYYQKSLL